MFSKGFRNVYNISFFILRPTQDTLFYRMSTVPMTTIANYTNTDEVHCTRGALLGPFGLLVQGSLAIVAFGALVGRCSIL